VPNWLAECLQCPFFWKRQYPPQKVHYGCKDYEELDHILGARETRHVVVIDDARLFGTDPAYPTLDAVAAFVKSRSPKRRMTVDCDCIQILPG
jgi:hypothetical protein